MTSSCTIKCIFIITVLCYISGIRTEVPEYCLQPLNRSDCGVNPIAVMTYWKPGSRCEVVFWRGCPTANKFEDEYECTATCIFRQNISDSAYVIDDSYNEWEHKLEDMQMADLQKLNSLLNTVVTDTTVNENVPENINLFDVISETTIVTTTTEEPTKETATAVQEQASTEKSTTEQDATEQGATEQDTTEHGTTEQGATEQDTTEHGTTEQDATEHGATEQSVTEQDATEQDPTDQTANEVSTTEHSITEHADAETNATTAKVESSEGESDEIDVVTTY